jgi:alkyl hydroperoxide reductase subunit D
MEFLNDIKERIPDYAKDVRLNLDAVIVRSSLPPNEALGVALAAAYAAKSTALIEAIGAAAELPGEDKTAALTAAALMGITNVWYTYVDYAADPELKGLQAQLRMNAYQNHGGVDKRRFELYALAASIVGKCKSCIGSHYATLKQEGMTPTQLRDVGRIAAVIQGASLVFVAEENAVQAFEQTV